METAYYHHFIGAHEWNLMMEAIHAKDEEYRNNMLAHLMQDAGESIRIIAALTDRIEEEFATVRRIMKVRRIMLKYLDAQGLAGEPLKRRRDRTREQARAEWRARERERDALEEAFRHGPNAYDTMVRTVRRERERRARAATA